MQKDIPCESHKVRAVKPNRSVSSPLFKVNVWVWSPIWFLFKDEKSRWWMSCVSLSPVDLRCEHPRCRDLILQLARGVEKISSKLLQFIQKGVWTCLYQNRWKTSCCWCWRTSQDVTSVTVFHHLENTMSGPELFLKCPVKCWFHKTC